MIKWQLGAALLQRLQEAKGPVAVTQSEAESVAKVVKVLHDELLKKTIRENSSDDDVPFETIS